jgi:hypothetical protein
MARRSTGSGYRPRVLIESIFYLIGAPMLPSRLATFAAGVLLASAAAAETPGEFSLNSGLVKFTAPPAWPVIMQKIEGNPQAVAFQVKDPADEGTGEATRVTVTTKLLDDTSLFQGLVNADVNKGKQMPEYEKRDDGVDASVLRFFARNGKTRYEFRETWYLNGHVLVHIRCARPMLDKTTAQWTTEYEKGCAEIMASAKPH